MEIDEKTREVHSFICVNMLVSPEEGRKLNKEMKKKYSAIISEAELNKMESELVMDVENPRQLEKAILNLITNLNNPPYDDDDTASESSKTSKAPLAIVAPRELSVKQQVVKAYEVISTAKGCKKIKDVKDEPLSPDACASSSTAAAGSLAIEGQTKLSSQYVKAEPGSEILSPNSLYSVSSHDSDLNSPPQVYHGSSSYANRNPRTNAYYSNYENLPRNSDPDTQASFRNSSSDSFSSNNSNYNSAPALETIVDNSQRSSVLKRTHHDINADNNDDNEEYTAALLKRRLLSNDLTPVSQNLPLDLFAPSNVVSGSGTKTCFL